MGTYTPPVPPKEAEEISQASTPELFAGLIHDARDLAVGHLEQMRGEMGDELKNLKHLMRNVVIAVGVMVIGAILAGHFVAIVLIAIGLPAWLAYGITAAVAILAGILVIKRLPTERKDADLIPEDSLASLKRDVSDVAHHVRE